jgi:hypothetical protein
MQSIMSTAFVFTSLLDNSDAGSGGGLLVMMIKMSVSGRGGLELTSAGSGCAVSKRLYNTCTGFWIDL